ncbi:hypothetical protein [Alteromonas gilva]|uniref:NirD/YgiW/YdeI family stress tolerance protein n=1 Tax=Alteromonas gilva TaxID=2987522 RepID=A0ABT5L5C3_9ALTE|nr:hypothetical protein [Alteromonas gilva]MDC8832264.1 hypothetical protein [Alteromonas gilva]
MNIFKLSLIAAATSVVLGTTAMADNHKPSDMKDRAWATFSGEVTSVNPDSFMLDYGEGSLLVEVDDGDYDNDAYKLFKGDDVTVTGRIDKNLFADTTLEASGIYVKGLNTTFFSSALDEEDYPLVYTTSYVPMELDTVTLVGNVIYTNDLTDNVTIMMGGDELEVDVSDLGYDPLDDEGWLKIAAGDRIQVSGTLDEGFLDDYELVADTLTKLDG